MCGLLGLDNIRLGYNYFKLVQKNLYIEKIVFKDV